LFVVFIIVVLCVPSVPHIINSKVFQKVKLNMKKNVPKGLIIKNVCRIFVV